MALLATKSAVPPLRASRVPRPRLLARLDAARRDGVPLMLVSAPAGFGKTLLVAEWLHARKLPAAWVTIDEADNDPARAIAEELTVALNTVKKHTSHIFGKLGVTSRTQAIARARDLGLG